eukprot:5276298-Pyramimonas_sp.AAC.1
MPPLLASLRPWSLRWAAHMPPVMICTPPSLTPLSLPLPSFEEHANVYPHRTGVARTRPSHVGASPAVTLPAAASTGGGEEGARPAQKPSRLRR